jgi:Domain of unknown function (DUF4352)
MHYIHRLLPFVVLVFTVFGFVACGDTGTNTGTNTGAANTPSSGNTPTSTTQHFKVGNQVKVGNNWIITVNSAKTDAGSEFNKPQKANDVFLIFSISAKNASSQEQIISSFAQFTLLDSTGQKYDLTIDTDAGSTLDGKVEAGQTLKGAIAYEVPKTMHAFTLGFEADITSPGQTIWDIKV